MRTGTSYFVSMNAALQYYAYEGATQQDIYRKIAEGLIHIGRPEIKPGQRLLLIDDNCRWAIEG